VRKIIVILVLTIGAGTALIVYALKKADVHHYPERREWKNGAIQAIRGDLKEPDHLVKRFGEIPEPRSYFDTSEAKWLTKDTIVCADGAWLAYRAQCHKQDPKVHDIFIAKASDGKWYYSDYHFCIDVYVLASNGQPESLDRFKEDYSLAEFDGQSDEALNPTWIP
jgi:hypothetical protein